MSRLITFTLITVAILCILRLYFFSNEKKEAKSIVKPKPVLSDSIAQQKRLITYGKKAGDFAATKKFNTSICFLLDMRLHAGRKRFFIYDIKLNKTIAAGLVAHGSCNTNFMEEARFSNKENCGCSSLGKYKVSNGYYGRFGLAFKLIGLETSNSNAFRRFIVLHSYYCVPDGEVYPGFICNSQGCPMVSPNFQMLVSKFIKASRKPIILWMFN